MNTQGRKKSRRSKSVLLTFTTGLLLSATCAYTASSMFLRSYENSLSVQMQTIQNQISAVETDNEEIQNEVNTYASQNRVEKMAENSLSYQAQNIVSVDEGQ